MLQPLIIKTLMDFITYLFYKLINYYRNEGSITSRQTYAFLNIGALIMLNLLSMVFLLQTIFDIEIIRYFLSTNTSLNRFVLIPLSISPIFIGLFLFYRRNQNRINAKLKELKNADKDRTKRLNRMFWSYIIGTIALFFMSLVSPLLRN